MILPLSHLRWQFLHRSHPLQLAIDVGSQPVGLPHGGDGGALHINVGKIVLPNPRLSAAFKVAEPFRVNPHGLYPDAIRSDKIRGSDGDSRSHWSTFGRPHAFH